MKRDVTTAKNQALRQALQTKQKKGKTLASLKKMLDSTVQDDSPDKIVSHLKLQAHAYECQDAFHKRAALLSMLGIWCSIQEVKEEEIYLRQFKSTSTKGKQDDIPSFGNKSSVRKSFEALQRR